eukprot:3432013-Rhodomonas_salina.3
MAGFPCSLSSCTAGGTQCSREGGKKSLSHHLSNRLRHGHRRRHWQTQTHWQTPGVGALSVMCGVKGQPEAGFTPLAGLVAVSLTRVTVIARCWPWLGVRR